MVIYHKWLTSNGRGGNCDDTLEDGRGTFTKERRVGGTALALRWRKDFASYSGAGGTSDNKNKERKKGSKIFTINLIKVCPPNENLFVSSARGKEFSTG